MRKISQKIKPFDRDTGEAISQNSLKTYHEALAQYHMHPESKFLNGDYCDTGTTNRRHIQVTAINRIGKEANQWEKQFFLGYDTDSQVEYGLSDEQRDVYLKEIKEAVKTHGTKSIANAAQISDRYLRSILNKSKKPSEEVLMKLYQTSKHPLTLAG